MTLVYARKRLDYGAALLRKIAQLESENALSLEQKILLAETGTVEQVLSIIAGTPIKVIVERQAGRDIIEREVTLVAEYTGRPLIRAASRIYCESLPAGIVRKLRQKKSGIGTIMLQSKLETFRQIVRMGMKGGKPYRVYRILHGGRIAFEIREVILI